jgi:hypothetical protein
MGKMHMAFLGVRRMIALRKLDRAILRGSFSEMERRFELFIQDFPYDTVLLEKKCGASTKLTARAHWN